MSEPFDPYYHWLGIPPEEAPPNHYRLLGIPTFQADANIIRAAAEQRYVYLRTFQLSKHAELAEKLLNKVAAAKTCLLDPKAKATYDASLKGNQESSTPSRIEELAKVAPVPAPREMAAETPVDVEASPRLQTTLGVRALARHVGEILKRPDRLWAAPGSHHAQWWVALTVGGLAACLVPVAGILVYSAIHRGAVDNAIAESSDRPLQNEQPDSPVPPAPPVGASTALPAPSIPPRSESKQPPLSEAPSKPQAQQSEMIRGESAHVAPVEGLQKDFSSPSPSSAAKPLPDSNHETARDPDIRLPSGDVFREAMIVVDHSAAARLKAYAATEAESVLVVSGLRQRATAYVEYEQNKLHGLAVVCDDKNEVTYQATYEYGRRHGWLVAWNPAGQRTYALEYTHGNPGPFSCLFDNDRLRMIVEYADGRRGGLAMVADGKVEKSFQRTEEIGNDEDARKALVRMDERQSVAEKTIGELEKQFRPALNALVENDERKEKRRLYELTKRQQQEEERQKKAAAAAHSAGARARIQLRIDGRNQQRELQMRELQKKTRPP